MKKGPSLPVFGDNEPCVLSCREKDYKEIIDSLYKYYSYE